MIKKIRQIFGLEIDMNLGRWAELIYNDRDIGRGFATTIAGAAGLATYLYWKDWVAAAFVTIIIFPAVRIMATSIHAHWIRSRQRNDSTDHMAELFNNLASEEQAVVQVFVRYGGSVITWGQFDRSPHVSLPGIESLINRGLVQTTLTADGMREAFALDTKLFDYAQTILSDESV